MYYIISDLNFNSADAVKKQKMEIKEYNESIIKGLVFKLVERPAFLISPDFS